jgi:hypothetical protein
MIRAWIITSKGRSFYAEWHSLHSLQVKVEDQHIIGQCDPFPHLQIIGQLKSKYETKQILQKNAERIINIYECTPPISKAATNKAARSQLGMARKG